MANIEERVEKLIEPIIEKIGYELYDVEYAKEGKNYFLRIFIDSEKGIDLNDCEKVNDAITDILDEEISVKLFKKDENGKKEYKGILEGFDEGYIKIKEENQEFKIERKNISQIKTVYNWD